MTDMSDSSRDSQIPPKATSRRWANWGLAAFLLAECGYGISIGSESNWDIVWWVTVAAVLVFNTCRRSAPAAADTRWWVWLICVASSIRFLAFEYDEETRTAFWLLIVFNLIADSALIALGKSFSLLPARRQIRTGWMYRYVRHPAYAAYIITDIVYVYLSPSPRNGIVLLVGILLFIGRALLEEKLLSADPAYQKYRQQTHWRFIPLIF